MFVMHIKQFPQFIPSSKRKYALKAIQFNFDLLYLPHSRSLTFTIVCCALRAAIPFSYAHFRFPLVCLISEFIFFSTPPPHFSSILSSQEKKTTATTDEEIICKKAKEMT